ncbi:MAG: hypothetical protein HYT34_00110 [Candidatus Ryanbacteria bacterium]|nr:hypothetical protein [Candidatus Ryanbacteria bacterium]
MNTRRQIIFIGFAFLVMLVWLIYTQFFMTDQLRRVIIEYGLDKIIHALGGAWVAALFLLHGEKKIFRLLVFTVLIAVLWEMGELLFDPEVQYFFARKKNLWLQDSLSDIASAFLGAIVYRFTQLEKAARPCR